MMFLEYSDFEFTCMSEFVQPVVQALEEAPLQSDGFYITSL